MSHQHKLKDHQNKHHFQVLSNEYLQCQIEQELMPLRNTQVWVQTDSIWLVQNVKHPASLNNNMAKESKMMWISDFLRKIGWKTNEMKRTEVRLHSLKLIANAKTNYDKVVNYSRS